MKSNSFSKKSIFTFLALFNFTLLLHAQTYIKEGTSYSYHTDNYSNLLIGTTGNLHNDVNAWHEVGIHAGTVGYGNRTALFAKSYANASTGQANGLARATLATSADWFANGWLIGVSGIADSVSVLNNTTATGTSTSTGGHFFTRINNPIVSPTVGTYNITGVETFLIGNISTYPNQGVVAALYADDRISGTGTWAGYFDGRGYYRNNVGIATTNPLSLLSVNGDGNSNWTGYFKSTSTTNGTRAIMAEADQATGFADNVYAIHGRIESGTGYAYGVRGDAFSLTPSSNGRSYGLFAQAGNATSGANYGLYSLLSGSNTGAAILGFDEVNHASDFNGLLPDASKTWAGYFVGDMFVHDQVGIACDNFIQPSSSVPYRLFVNGGVRTKELLIDNTGWCDYVFEDHYKLMPLKEVEAHIEETGHLHNTPSAKDIEAFGGVELGAMTRNQQEKIEEIFLHLIALNKTLEMLKVENETLRQQLANQQK